MKKIKAKKSEYIELTEKLNCIPPGVYKVVEMDSESIQLSVSDRIEWSKLTNVNTFS